ncbi:MAG: undecaprenyl-phosphate alpha-N-acetylglucosaminyl 1-phosphate transferase, partial [Desulfovibrionales bacterium]|nr:undecaprenyl-phosphate alpha-N-acetylglucosaminyl 1-phosphate transferase [Desulfovibrionales bacterium]
MDYLLIVIVSFLSLHVAAKIAVAVGLTDVPNYRKLHIGEVPLVGGIALYICIACFILLHPKIFVTSNIYLFCCTLLFVVGVLDDRFNVNYRIRLIVQGIIVAIMISKGYYLSQLGTIFFFEVTLPDPIAYLITSTAVIGAINAFNMVDGVDGVLGATSIVFFLSLGMLQGGTEDSLLPFCL